MTRQVLRCSQGATSARNNEARKFPAKATEDADAFKLYLVGEKLAPTTIHKRLQFARTFFRSMLRHKIVTENPFAEVKSPATGTAERQQFITREEIARVLAVCPNHHWRAIVALARFGGLRCPSEVLSLR